MRRLPFWKMHGTGNDFVLMASDEPDARWPELAIAICDRHFGVGADGLILVLPSKTADRRMRIFNADGSEAEMCGNGIRCFVKYCLDGGVVRSPDGTMTVETIPGVLTARATFAADGTVDRVRVGMGVPDFEPAHVGVRIEQPAPVTDMPVTVRDDRGEESVTVALVSMGNPHAVSFIDGAPADYPLERVGPLMEHHPAFAHRTNFEVVRVRDRAHVDMRVWERGVGETLACGSGACAVVAAARTLARVDDAVAVALPGGVLEIEWDGAGEISLTGPATRVFVSEWEQP
ncbi:MAG: diaminopimelate epimerase [Chloroflexi bacterium]|nr:diaminopimelate epimerase [Chloroflexota bacterium]MDA1002122.1 diaminopimelate epimerase [Chloroflexota bacterium]